MRVPSSALVAAVGVVATGALAWPFTVDDAFIVARYADALAGGAGYATDGVTGPAWIAPMALAIAIGLSPLAVAKTLGLGMAALAAMLATARVRGRVGGRRAAWLTALVMALSPQLAAWAVSGLETGAATLLATLAVLGATERPRPRPFLVGSAIGGLAWLRPELALFSIVLLAALALRSRGGPGEVRSPVVRATLVALALAGALVALRLSFFGDPLPLAFHAKPGEPSLGSSYVASGLLVITGAGGLLLAALAVHRGRGTDRAVGAALLAHLVAVVLAGGDWMPGFRLLVPLLPAYAMLVGAGATVAARPLARRRRSRVWNAAVLSLALLALAAPLFDAVAQIPELRASGDARERIGRPLACWLASRGESVALVDAGFLPWASGLEVTDLAGVTEPIVARAPGGYLDKQIDLGWLAARDPDLVILHAAVRPTLDADRNLATLAGFPVERRIAASAWLRAHYHVTRVVEYTPSYWYAVLERRSR